MRIVSSILILVSVYISVSHGMRTFNKPTAEYIQMMSTLGISNTARILFGIISITSAVLILFPKSFFAGNTLRAILLIVLMALSLKAGNYKFALIEIPFLLLPLVLIYLGHPLRGEAA